MMNTIKSFTQITAAGAVSGVTDLVYIEQDDININSMYAVKSFRKNFFSNNATVDYELINIGSTSAQLA